ncbi:hypothetical protein P3S68_012605 [Capsicum galapagoense]
MPTEFYNLGILERIGKMLGTLVKVDACISSTLRGRYARVCVQIPLKTPLLTSILIGDHLQQIQYEGEGFLCKVCSCLGHIAIGCKIKLPLPETQNKQSPENPKESEQRIQEWQTTIFKRGKSRKANYTRNHITKAVPGKSSNPHDDRTGPSMSTSGISGGEEGKAPLQMLSLGQGWPNYQAGQNDKWAKNNYPQQNNKGKDLVNPTPKPTSEAQSKGTRSPNNQHKVSLTNISLGTKKDSNANPNVEVLSLTQKVSKPRNPELSSSCNTPPMAPNLTKQITANSQIKDIEMTEE